MRLSGEKKYAVILCFLYSFSIKAQKGLDWYIDQATRKSLPAQQLNTALNIAQLNFKAFQLTNKPTVSVYGNIPSYNKDNYAVTQPDGSIQFLPRSQNYSNAGIGFIQPLGFSGGSLSVNTDLYRFDNFTDKTKQYNGAPFFIRLTQPVFGYNAYKWEKKIAPIRLQEASLSAKQELLQLEYETCRLYFDVIEAQVNEELAITNFINATSNIVAEKRRWQLGTSTEDKVLQLEIQLLNSEQARTEAAFNKSKGLYLLRNYIGSTDTGIVKLLVPENLPLIPVDRENILSQSKKSIPFYLAYERQQVELHAKEEEARKNGRQVDVAASYGFNNTSPDLTGIYTNPQNQQRFSIGINIPIADWGRRKNNVVLQKLNAEQAAIKYKQDEQGYITEITNLLNELPLLQKDIEQKKVIDTIAHKRFVIANRLFQSGKIPVLEIQAAEAAKDNSRRAYVLALRRFWESWYLLRIKTGITEF